MEEIKKSNHRNYLPSYPFSTKEIIEKYIIPNWKYIFEDFSNKIAWDAEKDWARGRNFLKDQWIKASNCCKKLAMVAEQNEWNHNPKLVEEIINMDYKSVADFFEELSNYYKLNKTIYQELIVVKEIFDSMWKVSASHTNIISKALRDAINK